MSALKRTSSYFASLNTLPVNPKLQEQPKLPFKGSALEPFDDPNASRDKRPVTNKNYWKKCFKLIAATATIDNGFATESIKKAAHNYLVDPRYLALTNLAVRRMHKFGGT